MIGFDPEKVTKSSTYLITVIGMMLTVGRHFELNVRSGQLPYDKVVFRNGFRDSSNPNLRD